MSQTMTIVIEAPDDLSRFRLPAALRGRLKTLLDKQDAGGALTAEEAREADGLVDMADLLSLLRLSAQRLNGEQEQACRFPSSLRLLVGAGRATIAALGMNRPLALAIRREESLRGRHPG